MMSGTIMSSMLVVTMSKSSLFQLTLKYPQKLIAKIFITHSDKKETLRKMSTTSRYRRIGDVSPQPGRSIARQTTLRQIHARINFSK
jgi:hypothetical protein